jgi:hypothetical protein
MPWQSPNRSVRYAFGICMRGSPMQRGSQVNAHPLQRRFRAPWRANPLPCSPVPPHSNTQPALPPAHPRQNPVEPWTHTPKNDRARQQEGLPTPFMLFRRDLPVKLLIRAGAIARSAEGVPFLPHPSVRWHLAMKGVRPERHTVLCRISRVLPPGRWPNCFFSDPPQEAARAPARRAMIQNYFTLDS